jgi:hypothetical protein
VDEPLEDPRYRRYPRRAIRILLEGGELTETPEGWEWRDLPSWAELRTYVERTGDVDAWIFATVIDLERAVGALLSYHPEAAVVVAAVMLLDLDGRDLDRILGGRRNWSKVQTRAIAWIASWLSGSSIEECEVAWKKARG